MIRYSEDLIADIEAILRVGFNHTSIQLNRRSDRKIGPFKIILQESYATGTKLLDGRVASEITTQGVHPDTFYFGFVAVFEVSQAGEEMHAHVLQHVSLSLFQAYPLGDLQPVVRAEWDWGVVTDPKSHHAQPHWHFTQSAKEIEAVVRTMNEEEIEFGSPLIFDKLLSIGGAHFNMSKFWGEQNSNTYKYDFVDKDDFVNWFRCLITYTSAQLVYLCGGQASEVMEFQG